jgi:TPR repeat protein
MYLNGQGVSKDYKVAVKWYTLAAEQANTQAQINLGAMYGDGDGVKKDMVYALMWANIAASLGDENIVLIEALEKKMTSADISATQKLTRECVAKNYKGC